VLEVEGERGFVCGPSALPVIGEMRPESGDGRIARLSRDGLRYGAALGLADPTALAERLYAFGRQPPAPGERRRLRDRQATLEFLGVSEEHELGLRLATDWVRAGDKEAPAWLAWSRSAAQRVRRERGVYKLYVSPAVDALPVALRIVFDVFERRGGTRFKVGSDSIGLRRPDKLVFYFDDLESLVAVATEAAPLLSRLPAHGVPFSAEIGADGVLSWGMDPPAAERVLSWQEPESWRLWIVRRLAAALVAARGDHHAAIDPSDFALERLRLFGVDVERWTPSPSLWSAA
jgi:hypothetical protein